MTMRILVITVLMTILMTLIYFLKPGVILAENDDKEEEEESSNAENSENSDSDDYDSDEEESNKKWSDRALMNKYGKITAIGIEEEKNGSFIQKMRARCLLPPPLIPPSRYGREEEGWSQWREVHWKQEPNPRIHQVELSSSTHLSSYCPDGSGSLFSLAVTNLDNGTQQVFGRHEKHADDWSLRESPPLVQSSLAFTHLYGVESEYTYYGDYSVCFNIE